MAKETVKNNETVGLKKVSATFRKLSDFGVGDFIEGKFVGLNTRDVMDDEGELKQAYTCVIETEKGEREKFFADAGFRIAISDAMLEKGDWFRAVKCEQVKLQGGRKMNQWDIFVKNQ